MDLTQHDEAMGGNTPTRYPFEFHGKHWEFFKIWFVNSALTIITLGFYSPWAKVRTKRYFYGNTFINNANFEYHASPLSILVARIILLVVILGGAVWAGEKLLESALHSLILFILLPWALVRGLAFNARYSSYRNVRFSFQKNTAVYGKIYLIYLLPIIWFLLNFIVLLLYGDHVFELDAPNIFNIYLLLIALNFIFLPWLVRAYHAFKASNHRWGQFSVGFVKPSVGRYILPYWVYPLLIFIVAFTVMIAAVVAFGWFSGGSYDTDISPSEEIFIGVVSIATFIFCYMLFYAVVVGYTFRLYWQSLVLPGGGKIICGFNMAYFVVGILLINSLLVIFSLGLLYPWTKIRKARFLAHHMQLEMPSGAMEQALSAADERESAFGEEFSAAEGFDFDVGLI